MRWHGATRVHSFAPLMKVSSLVGLAVLLMFACACERHPLAGDPHPAQKHAEHGPANPAEGGADKQHGKAPGHIENAQPVTQTVTGPPGGSPGVNAKPENAPRFFPQPK